MKKLAILLAAAAALPAHAEDIYERCTAQYPAMNNSVVYQCASESSEAYKRKINRTYQKIYAALQQQDRQAAEHFEAAQKSWLAYRNRHCQMMGQYVGSPMYEYCPMLLNKARSEELEELSSSF
ncbi:lysozyme inhibitor LprI family protein [Bergeriella denitrificans]|uniref:Uncharacterized protein conserved in bacteria n=1 Tax=Bergeriella denitrificans TaxID=494 RepID=A0A378UJK3_BERDE|nr:lysozyme inhibitor LprI family protein [Bergeriella denitrificans]STZ76903.1 Uncharacterized protein conserved in bacteria [Bergeriella denitrificans]